MNLYKAELKYENAIASEWHVNPNIPLRGVFLGSRVRWDYSQDVMVRDCRELLFKTFDGVIRFVCLRSRDALLDAFLDKPDVVVGVDVEIAVKGREWIVSRIL